MTYENKKLLEEEIRLRNWNRICDGCEMPFDNEVVDLMYEDMDGKPMKCKAYVFNGKWIGKSDWVKGNYMCMCIAWKR